MITVKLFGCRTDGYRLTLREWYGGSDRPDSTILSNLTHDEADCLVQYEIIEPNFEKDTQPSSVDPRTMLVIKPNKQDINVLMFISNDGVEMPLPVDLNNTFDKKVRSRWYDRFRRISFTLESGTILVDIPDQEEWSDNPTEVVAFW